MAGALLRELVFQGDDNERAPGTSTETDIHAELATHPRDAARDALATAREDDSVEVELAMLDVAIEGKGIERTVDTGDSQVMAAIVLESHLITSGASGEVKVWRRSDGALLGKVAVARPIVALADTESSSSVIAALDEQGAVELVNVSDPGRPRVLLLGPRLTQGERPLAVAFSQDGSREIVAVGSGGELLRINVTTGALVSRDSLSKVRGSVPWSSGTETMALTTASFVPEIYEDEEGLLVAMEDGAVVDVDIRQGTGKTVLAPGIAPGRILAVDRTPYGEHGLVVGAQGGSVVKSEDEQNSEPSVLLGPPVPAVALDSEEGAWTGTSEGMTLPEMEEEPFSGPSVQAFEPSQHGLAAINPNGMVSVLGPADVGISMAKAEATPAAAFDSQGRLLVAYGYDPNHVEKVRALRPEPALPDGAYQEEVELQTYLPDPDWWREAEDPEAFYVNDIDVDTEYVVAAGQDPFGNAAVVVWDAASGKPLQELELGLGGISAEAPSILSKVMLLPSRHEVVVYSVAQEMLAVWSTDTWELEDSIPVGPAGDISAAPDDSTIAVVGLGADPEFYVAPDEPVDIKFVDLDAGKVDHTVQINGAAAVAFSPDGSTLAVADENGMLQLRSADGREREAGPIELGDTVKEMSWRPDGALLAVAGESDVVLVDPDSGEVSEPLPSEDLTLGLNWNQDGSLLVTETGQPDEDGEGYEPVATDIWTLGVDALRHRMCQLAGCSQRQDGAAAGALEDVSRLDSINLVFRHEGDLVAADARGNTARIGRLEEFSNPGPVFGWSSLGLTWSSPQQINAVLTGDRRPRSWPCACSGVAWDKNEIVSLSIDGSHLVHIDPATGSVHLTAVRGLPNYYPTLLGVIGSNPIVAAYGREPDRSTFSQLFVIKADGAVAMLPRNAGGTLFDPRSSSSPNTVAFVSLRSSGACYSFARVGIITATSSGIKIKIPPSPLGDEPSQVRSLQVAPDGSVSAAFAPLGCDVDGVSEEQDPLAERYVLVAGQWRSTGERGFDVQVTGDGTAVLGRGEKRGDPGVLNFASDDRDLQLEPETESMAVRP